MSMYPKINCALCLQPTSLSLLVHFSIFYHLYVHQWTIITDCLVCACVIIILWLHNNKMSETSQGNYKPELPDIKIWKMSVILEQLASCWLLPPVFALKVLVPTSSLIFQFLFSVVNLSTVRHFYFSQTLFGACMARYNNMINNQLQRSCHDKIKIAWRKEIFMWNLS